MSRRTISLSRELWVLVGAVRGVRRLAESAMQSPDIAHAAYHGEVSALLAILEGRLAMFERAIAGEVDPALAWCESNCTTPGDDTPDQKLVEWSAKHAVRKARAELRRAKRRREQLRVGERS